jgi:hypothetical protein
MRLLVEELRCVLILVLVGAVENLVTDLARDLTKEPREPCSKAGGRFKSLIEGSELY